MVCEAGKINLDLKKCHFLPFGGRFIKKKLDHYRGQYFPPEGMFPFPLPVRGHVFIPEVMFLSPTPFR